LQVDPSQQLVSAAPAQGAPSDLHVVCAAQRSTPVSSGTQGEFPQHWSRNWHTSPVGMQHCGSEASQPVVQVSFTGPPKQRRMPPWSGLHTAFPLPPPS
jgi:hypothetical protein